LKHRFFDFTKVAFATSRRQLMSSEDHSTTWNTVYSTSSKWHFLMPSRQKMIPHGLSTAWNIALSTTRKSHFGPNIRGKMKSPIHECLILCGLQSRKFVRRAYRPLEILLSRHHPSRIFGRPEGRNEISETFDPLKHPFRELGQVALFFDQKAQN
jgi:hypothetical protein